MTIDGVPVQFFLLLAVGVLAALGLFGCGLRVLQKLGLKTTRHGSEWTLSREDNALLTKAIWGGNAQLTALGVSRLVWAVRLLFVVVAASVAGCSFILAGAA